MPKKTTSPSAEQQPISIPAPEIHTVGLRIHSTAPYVQLRFSMKAQGIMLAAQVDPTAKKGRKNREPKNIEALYEEAMYRTADDRHGIPASAFRNAMIRATSLVNFKMTQAKMSIFVEADDFDAEDGTPLVYINGDPERVTHTVRNATGVADIRVRAMWRTWSAALRLTYDADQFREQDVVNLLERAGLQVGVGEGRPFSKNSAGMGWGTFTAQSPQLRREA